MKRRILGSLMFMTLVCAAGAMAAAPDKEWRIGLRPGMIHSLQNSDTLVNTTVSNFILEIDTKKSGNQDIGFRLGYDGFATRSPGYYACYNLIQLGFGSRFYFDERKSPESEYHTFKRYLMTDVFAILALKNRDLDPPTVAPQNLFGLGAKAGAGLEYVMGPLSSAFAELEYALTDLKENGGAIDFPAQGMIVAFGVRLTK